MTVPSASSSCLGERPELLHPTKALPAVCTVRPHPCFVHPSLGLGYILPNCPSMDYWWANCTESTPWANPLSKKMYPSPFLRVSGRSGPTCLHTSLSPMTPFHRWLTRTLLHMVYSDLGEKRWSGKQM